MKCFLHFAATVLAICFSHASANAKSCYGHSDLSDGCAQIIDIAVYGDTDRRRTEEEFAGDVGETVATIHNRFAATGALACKGIIPCPADPSKQCSATLNGSAQLTLGTDIITTASHVLDDSKTCQVNARAEDCTFTIAGNGSPQVIKVASLVDQGYKCPTIHTADMDWAVMRLSRRVKDIVPYRIDADLIQRLKAGDKVLNVCRSKDFVRQDSHGRTTNPKHINNCSIKAVYRANGNPIYLSTDCDSADFCSGGSLLSGNQDEPALLGISVRNGEEKADLENAVKNHTVNKRPFDEQTWGARYLPFSGDFLEAVKRANAQSASRDSI